MTRFYILRHGETDWNRDGNRYCGRSDIPLSEHGADQARRAAERLAAAPIEAICSSTLLRARETAAPLAERLGLDVRLDARIAEIDFGRWEGLRPPDIRRDYGECWEGWHSEPERTRAGVTGETAKDVYGRMLGFFTETAALYPDGHVAVVSHSTSLRLFLAGMLGMPLSRYRHLIVHNTGICLVDARNGRFELVQLNGGLEELYRG